MAAKKKASATKKKAAQGSSKKKATEKKVTAKKATGLSDLDCRINDAKTELTSYYGEPVQLGGKRKNVGWLMAMSLGRLRVIEGHNPRKSNLTEAELSELTASIKDKGIVNPITVTPANGVKLKFNSGLTVASDDRTTYAIVAGERRFRAAKAAGVKSIPVVVRVDCIDPAVAFEVAVLENSEDSDRPLTPVEVMNALYRIKEDGSLSDAAVAKRTGFNIGKVRRLLKIADADSRVVEKFSEGVWSVDAALNAARFSDEEFAKVGDDLDNLKTADDIRKVRNDIAKGVYDTAEEGEDGEAGAEAEAPRAKRAQDDKTGASTFVWKGKRVVVEMLEVLCHHMLVNLLIDDNPPMEDGEAILIVDSAEFFEARGQIAALAWSRGMIVDVVLPDGDSTKKADKKVLRIFRSIIKGCALTYDAKLASSADESEAEKFAGLEDACKSSKTLKAFFAVK